MEQSNYKTLSRRIIILQINKNNIMTQEEIKAYFEDVCKVKLEIKDGKLFKGGYLDLRGTAITALPDNLTVGGSLDLEGTAITDTSKVNKNINEESFFEWRNNKYIKADGIFSKVISHKKNVFKIQKIGSIKESYLVTDGNGKFSHGDTIKEAKEDLIFKISNRDKSEYKGLTLESKMSFEKAIECYRIITGACSLGTKDFVNNRLNEKDRALKELSIRKMIEVTKGEYGNAAFQQFFLN